MKILCEEQNPNTYLLEDIIIFCNLDMNCVSGDKQSQKDFKKQQKQKQKTSVCNH